MAAVYAGLFSIHHRFLLTLFFAFMMLMNDWSTIWAMSFMASIFLHILLVHDTSDGVTSSFLRIGGLSCGIWFDGFSPDDFD